MINKATLPGITSGLLIPVAAVVCIKAHQKHLLVTYTDEFRNHTQAVDGTLKQWVDMSKGKLLQVHRSWVLNIDRVATVQERDTAGIAVLMQGVFQNTEREDPPTDGKCRVPVARRMRAAVRHALRDKVHDYL